MYIPNLSGRNLFSKFHSSELFCESFCTCNLCGISVFEPWNTFTSFAYILSAIIISVMSHSIDNISNNLKNLYICSIFILGLGTLLWHGKHILIFKIIDQIGMLLTVYTLLLCQVAHSFNITGILDFLTFKIPLLIIFIYFFQYKIMKYANIIFIITIGLNIGFMVYANIYNGLKFDKYSIFGLLSLIIGKILWIIDKKKIRPLHHYWHILTGLSILFFWISFEYNYTLELG
jgi:hypothetical protein|tara:strand:- start:16927 stop:17622 length:696 start_codon:yes stop_codon:yes gene_type:complete